MKNHRLPRIAEVIRQVASETILFKLSDPRVKLVTVTRAEVSGDLQHAKVFVSIMGSPKQQKLTMHGLESATGFIQSEVARKLQTRFTPALKFIIDEGVKKSIEITRLIREGLGQNPDTGEPLIASDSPENDEEGDSLENDEEGDSLENEDEGDSPENDDEVRVVETRNEDDLDKSPLPSDNKP
ncbi:MAG: 30S ribosome-binding factor RbfA [Planctomycetota bacterium]|nr:MAG: 30S ribosome-binding factor RbfA [Planctomycetota bacterium]